MTRRGIGGTLVGYVAVRLLLLWSMGGPVEHPDTISYRYGTSFLGRAPRTWPFPFALDAFGDVGVVIFQTTVSAVAFCVLAWTLAVQMQDRRVGWAVGAFVLLLGLAPRLTTWDQMLLTESLAISLTALLVAALVRIDRLPWWAVAGAFTLWVFIRDGHLFLGALVVAAVAWWGWKRRTVALPAATAVALLWCGFAAQNDRYVEGYNVAANIGGRILFDDWSETMWFVDRGMPIPTAMLEPETVPRIRGMYTDPTFQAWAEHDGVDLYAEYLATHSGFLLRGVKAIFVEDNGYRAFLSESLVDHSTDQRRSHGYPLGPAFVWPGEGEAYTLALIFGAILAALLVARVGKLDRRWIIPGAMLASTPLHALMAYHASPYEIARHGLVLAFMAVLSGWWMIALGVDAYVRLEPVGGGCGLDCGDVAVGELAGEDRDVADRLGAGR